MAADFPLFGPVHLAILAMVPATAALLAWIAVRSERRARAMRITFGLLLLVNELVWYAFRLYHEGFRFPEALPLQLCDVTLWLTVFTLLTIRPWSFDLAYYLAVGATTMAILTPELWDEFPSYPTIYFFAAHGGVVAGALFLIFSRQARPRPGSWWRTLLALNLYAAAVGLFNLYFRTNYMFLCEKPDSATLLDWFGPWPWYILAGEVFALVWFWLLWLPFRFTVPGRSLPDARPAP
jgi:hypothetical integral membrane protein (TIGR02206 family)